MQIKLIFTIILVTNVLFGFSQIDQALKAMQLYEGSVYVTYGHRITEEFSELRYHMGVGVFPKTNIAYLTYNQLIVLMQDTAKRQQWDKKRYLKSRNYFAKNAIGGRIVLYVERFDMYKTNNKFFFIIIRDTNDNKILEYNLPPRPANLVSTSVFSNWAYIDINKKLPEKFYIYVNHRQSDFLSDTKFFVEKNAAPLHKPEE